MENHIAPGLPSICSWTLYFSSGVYYVRQPIYAPEIARWLSRDPIGFRGSRWNLYSYVNCKPTRFLDPRGLKATSNVCIRESEAIGNWTFTDFGASQAVGFPSPQPGSVTQQEVAVTFLKCIYERTVTSVYRCHPCCWTNKGLAVPTPNTGTVTCKQIGEGETAVSQYLWVTGVAISWGPSWWPQGVPGGISITLFQDFTDDSDTPRARRTCRTLATSSGGVHVSLVGTKNPTPSNKSCPTQFLPGCNNGLP